MAKVIERLQAHYEIQDVAMGKVYRWCPQSLVLECTCGEELTLTAPEAACEQCGAEHTGLLTQDLTESRLRGGEETHPWRYYSVKSDSGTSLPY